MCGGRPTNDENAILSAHLRRTEEGSRNTRLKTTTGGEVVVIVVLQQERTTSRFDGIGVQSRGSLRGSNSLALRSSLLLFPFSTTPPFLFHSFFFFQFLLPPLSLSFLISRILFFLLPSTADTNLVDPIDSVKGRRGHWGTVLGLCLVGPSKSDDSVTTSDP